ncbi:hypothetical protein [Blastococcus sp. SYSU DS0973]
MLLAVAVTSSAGLMHDLGGLPDNAAGVPRAGRQYVACALLSQLCYAELKNAVAPAAAAAPGVPATATAAPG